MWRITLRQSRDVAFTALYGTCRRALTARQSRETRDARPAGICMNSSRFVPLWPLVEQLQKIAGLTAAHLTTMIRSVDDDRSLSNELADGSQQQTVLLAAGLDRRDISFYLDLCRVLNQHKGALVGNESVKD